MNKSIIKGFAALALCGTVALQSEAVESSIVGYQAIPIKDGGWSLLTVTFKDIGNDEFDLRKIIPADSSGVPLATSKNKFFVQKMDLTSGALTAQYKYTTASGKGWCNDDGDALTDDTTIKFKSGEAMCVQCGQGEDCTLLVSGEVVLEPVSCEIGDGGWSLIGNMTPVEIDLRDIIPCDMSGNPLATSKNKIFVQKMDLTSGALGAQYKYTTASGKGWCDDNGDALTDATTVKLTPGEAMCVQNGQGASIKFKFPEPIK